MAACNLPTVPSAASADQLSSKSEFWQTDINDDPVVHDSSCAERDVEDASCVLQADLFSDDTVASNSSGTPSADNGDQINAKHSDFQDLSANTESKTLFKFASVMYKLYMQRIFHCYFYGHDGVHNFLLHHITPCTDNYQRITS